jgi:hypothetical protein
MNLIRHTPRTGSTAAISRRSCPSRDRTADAVVTEKVSVESVGPPETNALLIVRPRRGVAGHAAE